MKKEAVLKQYWKANKGVVIRHAIDVIFWCLVLIGLCLCNIFFTSALKPIGWAVVWILILCFAFLCGIGIALKSLINTRKEILKINAEEYRVYEDTIVDKYVKRVPFFLLPNKLHLVKFAHYEPEGRHGPHKNSILVDRKSYKKMQVGDVEHYLVLNDSKGRLACLVSPEEGFSTRQVGQMQASEHPCDFVWRYMEQRHCPNCGADLDADWKYCPQCGSYAPTPDGEQSLPTK